MDILLFLKTIVIAVVEGITEFLPISSTGHMILAGSLMDFHGDFANLFEIFIQFGAILAVIVLFWPKIIASFRTLRPSQPGFRLWTSVLAAFIPAAVIGVLLHKKIEQYLFRPVPIAISLLAGGLLLIWAERRFRRNRAVRRPEDTNLRQGFAVGLFQCLSLWPGFSRSASTIIGGWFVGMTTAAAAEFSFFLAIPTMFAASGYSLVTTDIRLTGEQIVMLLVGFVVAFLVAMLVVKKFIEYLRHKPLRYFAYYRIAVGVLILVLALFRVIRVG